MFNGTVLFYKIGPPYQVQNTLEITAVLFILEKLGILVNYIGIFIALAPGSSHKNTNKMINCETSNWLSKILLIISIKNEHLKHFKKKILRKRTEHKIATMDCAPLK